MATVIPEIETQFGANLTQIVAHRGYRGHNAGRLSLVLAAFCPFVPRRVSACSSEQHQAAFSQQRFARVLHG